MTNKTTTIEKKDYLQALIKYVPKGESPKVYIYLIEQILGVDAKGEPRPFEDLVFFLATCHQTGLNPVVKQIYPIYRWDSRLGKEKMTIQVGIDGMRLSAHRSGQYAGQDDSVFFPTDESAPHPIKATVTVYKLIKGEKVGTTATARWAEYAQTKDNKPVQLWAKMPYTMLAKCAEALALRKAFPNELSGVYTEEEMAQSTNPLSSLPTPDSKKKVEAPKQEPKVIHGAPAEVATDKDDVASDQKLTQEAKPVDTTVDTKTDSVDSGDKLVEARKKIAAMKARNKENGNK